MGNKILKFIGNVIGYYICFSILSILFKLEYTEIQKIVASFGFIIGTVISQYVRRRINAR